MIVIDKDVMVLMTDGVRLASSARVRGELAAQ
jgi:predicted acyl esterase